MIYEVKAEVPDDREGITTLVSVRSQSYADVWMDAEKMKARGWRVLSAPAPVKFPSQFPLERAA